MTRRRIVKNGTGSSSETAVKFPVHKTRSKLGRFRKWMLLAGALLALVAVYALSTFRQANIRNRAVTPFPGIHTAYTSFVSFLWHLK